MAQIAFILLGLVASVADLVVAIHQVDSSETSPNSWRSSIMIDFRPSV